MLVLSCIHIGCRLEVQQNDNDWQECATIVDSLAYTVKNLDLNSSYRFRVRAENIHGRSEPSLCSDTVTIADNNDNHGSAGMHVAEVITTDDNVDGEQFTIQKGESFKARFQLEDKLGKGRFGVVHRVVEHATGQVWAAKTVKCIKATDKAKVS